MSKPTREDLVAAALAATTARRRAEKPDRAQADAERLAHRLLSNWPSAPRRHPSASADTIRLLDRFETNEVLAEVAALDHTARLETAGVTVDLAVRHGSLDLWVQPIGVDFVNRLVLGELAVSDMQYRLRVKGGPYEP